MRIPLIVMIAIAGSAQGQVLIGSTTTTAGQASIVEVNPVSGAVRVIMTVPVPAGYEVYNMGALPPCRLAAAIQNTSTANNLSTFMKIYPATRTSETLSFTAPLSTSYTEGFDWSPRHNAFIMGYGPLGNFGTTRLALFDENGVVLANSGALPVGDLDCFACSATQDLFADFNRTTTPRVYQLSSLFPSPAVTAFASPPSMTNFHDMTIHPTSSAITFLNGNGSQLIGLVGNTYVNGPIIQGGLNLRGLTWAHLAPIITTNSAHAIACPTGQGTFSVDGVFDAPSTIVWQWKQGNGAWIPVVNGVNETESGEDLFIASGSGTVSIALNPPAAGAYPASATEFPIMTRCIITNDCGTVTSNEEVFTICIADFNCDASLDFFDYLDFVAAFSSSEPAADFNADTVVDFFDYLDFVQAFSGGC